MLAFVFVPTRRIGAGIELLCAEVVVPDKICVLNGPLLFRLVIGGRKQMPKSAEQSSRKPDSNATDAECQFCHCR